MADSNIKKGKIGNALESVAPDHVVAVANDIYDETLRKYQSELNQQIGQGGYTPPQGGIPKKDLSSDVQASLGKADNAITKAVDDLVNYYKKEQTYTKAEIDSLLSTVEDYEPVVGPLPSTGEEKKLYFVPANDNRSYSEYIWNGEWRLLAVHSGDIGSLLYYVDYSLGRTLDKMFKDTEHDFAIGDEEGNNIIELDEGHVKTQNFDSRKAAISELSEHDFAIGDEEGNNIIELDEGHVKTQNFDSRKAAISELSEHDFAIGDEEGNNIAVFEGGHIKTKNFDSSKFQNSTPPKTLVLPNNPIPIYIVCNDLKKSSNNWGVGCRNKSLDVYLDHFFYTNKEMYMFFNDNKSNYRTFASPIVGSGSVSWNNNQNKYEYLEDCYAGEDCLSIKVRSVLNSSTKNIYPKVLQIGDSVTEGWFANYPVVNNAPVQSYSWAKYYFQKDAQENGSLYKSLFVGHKNKSTFSYDGVTGTSYACGYSGKTAKWIATNQDSPFYTQNGFSLRGYLDKYRTLADDGETRLVVGSTAGSLVTNVNAWDLCTPNIVVLQLGMNDTNINEWKEYTNSMISTIKQEYPTIKIIVSVLDGCSCNYPSLYPNYREIFFDNYNECHTRLMEAYSYAIDNIQDESNGIYVIYSGMVMPMPTTCNVREIGGTFDGVGKRYVGVDSIERVPHPSRYAHAEIGYLLYSCIKWIL